MSGTSSHFAARILRVFAASAFSIALCSTAVLARTRRHSHRAHSPTPSPTATPSALKPVVLIVGGTGSVDRLTGQGPGVLSTAEIYDSARRSFLPIPSMNERRDQFAAAAISIDKVLVVGGVNTLLVPLVVFPGPAMPWVVRSAEIFSSSEGKFVSAPSMKFPRDGPTATMLETGKVLIVGGESSTAELYDPASNTFSETGSMAWSRHGQTATLLRKGGVLIAGGGFLKVEVYDPAAGKFHFAGKLSDNRLYHTATLLADGRVLIAGGCPFARSAPVDSSEIFDESRRVRSSGSKDDSEPVRTHRDAPERWAGSDRGRPRGQFHRVLRSRVGQVHPGTENDRGPFGTLRHAVAGRNRPARGGMGSRI